MNRDERLGRLTERTGALTQSLSEIEGRKARAAKPPEKE
jgi:hypothetical protein